MRIAITGAAGLFGHGLVRIFKAADEVYPLTRAEADITDAAQVEAALSEIKPDVVIHAAAIPDPDACELDPARAYAVNVHGTRNVMLVAQKTGARLAYISTDAVFDGGKTSPYTESDIPRPATVYGRTKLRSEEIVRNTTEWWIFRVSVLFGPGRENFVEKGLRRIAAGETYTAASDQVGNATYTLDAATKIREVIEAKRYGLYHIANSGSCTRLELARTAAALAGLSPERVVGKTLDEIGRPARRLKYAVMSCQALSQQEFAALRPWPEALMEYIGTWRDERPRPADSPSRTRG